MVTLYNDDCLNIMPTIKEKSIDLILCDLPYGVTNNKADIIIPFDRLWENYKRIIKDDGAILLFGQGIFFIDLINSNREMFRYDLIWDKQFTSGFLNANRMPLRQHEQIAVFYKNLPTYNPQMREGNKNHSQGTRYKEKEIVNNNYGEFHAVEDRENSDKKFPTSILSFMKPHPSKALHRTEKPVELLKYLILTYSNEGETVLDNCMGCGSTGVACLETNRNFIGIELDEKYFNVARNRLHESKESLF